MPNEDSNNLLNFETLDATQLTKIIAFDSYDDYAQCLSQHPELSQYLVGLVGSGGNVPNYGDENIETYGNLYYGTQKVTDIIVTQDTPIGNSSDFPNNKIYVKPIFEENPWELSGQESADPIGYEMYLKFNNMVMPIQGSGVIASTPFVVNLTPTSADFSGTMDKTVAEIYAAHLMHRKISFKIALGNNTYYETDCTARYYNSNTYPSFNGFIFTTGDPIGNAAIFAYTGATNDGSDNTYGVTIFPLTSM